MAGPGILFVLYGLGMDYTPQDMRLQVSLPTEMNSTLRACAMLTQQNLALPNQDKFAAVGLNPGNMLIPIAALVTGLLKISVPLNSWVVKSQSLAQKQFYVSIPGFALVVYSHRAIDLPLSEDIPCIVLPLCLGVLAFSVEKAKSK